ncbi:hypothetical protein L9F63_021524, partial [Diploptera punctata]
MRISPTTCPEKRSNPQVTNYWGKKKKYNISFRDNCSIMNVDRFCKLSGYAFSSYTTDVLLSRSSLVHQQMHWEKTQVDQNSGLQNTSFKLRLTIVGKKEKTTVRLGEIFTLSRTAIPPAV